ncbi:MAG: transcriptional regulator [SAR324 cluster bacterium]|uniref:Transcriptional regulator n=1 Tax=SAR324 cluster bacterium TaxID=2024889 RepID=A0A2A4SXG9_9DELT|nr:MAG: transcriptional regulator [SAR324 cluster bacterium]
MKIDRLMSILMMLLNCDRISAAQLAEKFEVTTRTIYRDVDTLGMAGIPVITYPGVYGGIGIMPEFKVDKKFFTAAEVSNLLIGLGGLSTALSQKEVAGTLEKVKSMLPREKALEIEVKASQITIDLKAWVGNKQLKPYLERIKKALDESRLMSFEYDGSGQKKSSRQVEPYQLILKEGHWYLYGYCCMRQDFRVFKLIRISELEILEITYEPREFKVKQLDGKGWIDKKIISIQLLVHKSLREHMLGLCGEGGITLQEVEIFLTELRKC